MSGLGFVEVGLVVLVLAVAIWTNLARASFAAAVGFFRPDEFVAGFGFDLDIALPHRV
jgi:hypoxanthine-guanine phosphoribosyltransferase